MNKTLPPPPVLFGLEANYYDEDKGAKGFSKSYYRSYLVEKVALKAGFSVVRYNKNCFNAFKDGVNLLFGASARGFASSSVAFAISDKHKGATQGVLESEKAAQPKGRIINSQQLFDKKDFDALSFPVVVKPVSGTGGAGVTVGNLNSLDIDNSIKIIQGKPRYANGDILLQEQVKGDVYRVMVASDNVVACVIRLPASITGDGVETVRKLIENKNFYREANPRLYKGLIDFEVAAKYIKASGFSMDDVLPKGHRVELAGDAYLNNGGDSIDITDELHDSIKDICIHAVRSVPGLNFCGVDIILQDYRKSAFEQSVGICELNSCPELITPQFPLFGQPVDVAKVLFEESLRHASPKCFQKLQYMPSDNIEYLVDLDSTLSRSKLREIIKAALNKAGLDVSFRLRNIDDVYRFSMFCSYSKAAVVMGLIVNSVDMCQVSHIKIASY